eukprot:3119052-Prymnesium_polylepis.1
MGGLHPSQRSSHTYGHIDAARRARLAGRQGVRAEEGRRKIRLRGRDGAARSGEELLRAAAEGADQRHAA